MTTPNERRSQSTLSNLLPPLLPEEYEALKKSIAADGYVGEPIIGDQDGGIVDGFHRQRACNELGIYCPREVRQFSSDSEKYELAIRLNCRRRQLSREQRQALIEVYLRCDPQIADNCLADVIGVSQNTVAKVRARLLATFQIEKFDKLRGRDGKERPTRYKRIVVNSAKEAEDAQKNILALPESCNGKLIDATTARRRAAHQRNQAQRAGRITEQVNSDQVKLFHCHFQDLERIAGVGPGEVNLVLTDIPYDQVFLPQVGDLGACAARVLVDGGLLVVLCGQYWLHKVIATLGEHLTYRWANASVWDGNATPIHIGGWKEPYGRVLSKWKPILVFSKGGFPKRGQWCDVSHVNSKEKDWHKWQQPLDEVEMLVRYFSDPGDLVIDPCAGGFTTAVACYRLGRRCISCDYEEASVANGQQRLREEMARAGSKKTA